MRFQLFLEEKSGAEKVLDKKKAIIDLEYALKQLKLMKAEVPDDGEDAAMKAEKIAMLKDKIMMLKKKVTEGEGNDKEIQQTLEKMKPILDMIPDIEEEE